MKIVGFNFLKLLVERSEKKLVENINVKSDLQIKKIEEFKSATLKSKENFLEIHFLYTLDYTPDYGKVELKGKIVISTDPKNAKNTLKKWKDNTLDEEFRINILNIVLRKATSKALELEDEVGLPFHMPMPSVKVKASNQEK